MEHPFDELLRYARQMLAEAELVRAELEEGHTSYSHGVVVGINRIVKLIERQKMKMIEVESSNINSVGYNKKTQKLRVLFKNDRLYEYHPVSQETFDLLTSAESVGRFFNEHIKTDPNVTVQQL